MRVEAAIKTLSLREMLSVFLALGKVKITFAVTITTAVGYYVLSGRVEPEMIGALIGVFILSSGSSAFNHYQERELDKFMERTRKRPLASGIITPAAGFAFASILTISGLAILLLLGINSFLLGLLALIWYNIIYTPMKRKSVWAVVPGSLIGSIPPVIGWAAAGGNVFDPKILALALFIFIWQIPHFWLLLLRYDKEYNEAGYPTLTKVLQPRQLARVTFMWVFSLACSAIIFPLFGLTHLLWIALIPFAAGARIIWKASRLLKQVDNSKIYMKVFHEINLFVLIVLFAVALNKFLTF